MKNRNWESILIGAVFSGLLVLSFYFGAAVLNEGCPKIETKQVESEESKTEAPKRKREFGELRFFLSSGGVNIIFKEFRGYGYRISGLKYEKWVEEWDVIETFDSFTAARSFAQGYADRVMESRKLAERDAIILEMWSEMGK